MKKRGRPPGKTGVAKQALVKVRCDAAEKKTWEEKARAAGLTLSEWVRRRGNG